MRWRWWLGGLAAVIGCAQPLVEGPSAMVPPAGAPSGASEATVAEAFATTMLEGDANPVQLEPVEAWRGDIYRYAWPSLDATLLGVDPARRRAYIKLRTRKPARYVIDTVDIDKGERVDRWEAGDDQAGRLSSYDGRFLPLGAEQNADLSRLATMVSGWASRAQREGSAWPVADASPGGDQVVYMRSPSGGQEGDWLFLHDVPSTRAVRIGRQAVASYDAKFSPDGSHLTWRGCVGRRPCRYFLYLSSVEAAAAGRAPHRITAAREPRGPIWSPSGDAVFVLATGQGGKRCIMRTTLPSRKPWRRSKTTSLVCDAKLASFVLSPDGASIVYTRRDGDHAEIAWRQTDEGQPASVVQVQQTSEVTVNDRGLVLADHLDGLLALDLGGHRRRMHVPRDGGFVFVPNIHWLGDDTALMLEKSFADRSVRLVRLDVKRFLAGS